MLTLFTIMFMVGSTHADQPPCEASYVRQCKDAVKNARPKPVVAKTSPLKEDLYGTGIDFISQRGERAPAAALQEAEQKCRELLSACQSQCPTRSEICQMGMQGPMKQAAQTEAPPERRRRPSSLDAEVVPKLNDHLDGHAPDSVTPSAEPMGESTSP